MLIKRRDLASTFLIKGYNADQLRCTSKKMQLDEIINLSNDRSNFASGMSHLALSRQTGSIVVLWNKTKGMFGEWQRMARDKQNKESLIVYRASTDSGRTFSSEVTYYRFQKLDSFSTSISFPLRENSESYDKSVLFTFVDVDRETKKINVYLARESNEPKDFALDKPILVSDPDTGVTEQTNTDNMESFVEDRSGNLTFKRVLSQVSTSDEGRNVYVLWTEMKTARSQLPLDEATVRELQKTAAGTSWDQFREIQRKISLSIPRYQISYQVYFKASSDGGRTFGERTRICQATAPNPGAPYSASPATVLASKNNVYIFIDARWSPDNKGLRLLRSSDCGKTFEESELAFSLAGEAAIAVSARPSLVRDRSEALFAMLRLRNKDEPVKTFEEAMVNPFERISSHVVFARTVDGGKTFEVLTSMPEGDPGLMGTPFVVSDDGNMIYLATIDRGRTFINNYDELFTNKSSKEVMESRIAEARQGGCVAIIASKDSGKTFGPSVLLADSRNIGLVGEFGVNVGLIPFGGQALFALKTRSINTSNARPNPPEKHESLENEQNTSDMLLWMSSDGGKTFEGPIIVNGDIKHSRGSLRNMALTGDNKLSGIDSTGGNLSLYLSFIAGSRNGYPDVYIRKLTVNLINRMPDNRESSRF